MVVVAQLGLDELDEMRSGTPTGLENGIEILDIQDRFHAVRHEQLRTQPHPCSRVLPVYFVF